MPITQERLAELEAELESLEAMPSGMKVQAYMPNFSDDAIWELAKLAEMARDYAPDLSQWIHSIAVEEIYRRASDDPVEARTPRLPVSWSNAIVGRAMLAALSLQKVNDLHSLDDFLFQLCLTLAVVVDDRLENTPDKQRATDAT